MEASRGVAGGGVSVPGWTGDHAKGGGSRDDLNSAKLVKDGPALHVTTGPAVTYWNPANKAKGDYTVKATFHEPKFMNLNTTHHPYGLSLRATIWERTSRVTCMCGLCNATSSFGFGPAPFK